MKLTKKFWTWISQVAAAFFLVLRVNLLAEIIGQIPNIDLSQLRFEFGAIRFAAILWLAWLAWRGVKGFTGEMLFLFDDRDHRW